MLTIDDTGKVYEYSEVNEHFTETSYAYPKTLKELEKHLKDNNISLPDDAKFSVSIDSDNQAKAITLVASDAPHFSQVFFDSKDEADKTIIDKKYRPSYNIMPDEIKELLNNFFNGKVCFFDGYTDLYSSFQQELENSPQSKHPSIKSSYEDKVLLKILNQQK